MEALERSMKGRTVITIAHRLSTIRNADKIVVLKRGVVAEEGSHDELIARNGVYAELYKIQFATAGPIRRCSLISRAAGDWSSASSGTAAGHRLLFGPVRIKQSL
jgi:ABC-type cobalamin transport system ATPase subunit